MSECVMLSRTRECELPEGQNASALFQGTASPLALNPHTGGAHNPSLNQ